MVSMLLVLSVAGLISSTCYLVLALCAAGLYRASTRRTKPRPTEFPAVSVLKPVHGMEPRLERNLESFFLQDYPDFEIIFGARHADDPALRIVATLQEKYPGVRTRIVLSGEPSWPNAKVCALARMVDVALAPCLVITDSDVCVSVDCLKQVVPPLLDSSVGVVTCLYRGAPAGGFWSKLEALGMSVEMTSGVLVARMLEGMKFALGPLMATRKDVIDAIGGIAALGDYCADDYLLGNRAHALGKLVVLSPHIIDHVAMNTSFGASLNHQIRWMRSTRFSRRAGHIGTGLTYAMPFGLLGMAAGFADGNWQLGAALLAWACVNRIIQAIGIGWAVTGDPEALRLSWLYPLRDLMGFLVWCASFIGTDIVWRNERYRLSPDGKMLIQRPRARR